MVLRAPSTSSVIVSLISSPSILTLTFVFTQRYLHHIKRHDQVMLELEDATKNYKDFEVAYKEFEVCFLFLC